MNWIALLVPGLKLLFKLLGYFMDTNSARKKIKKEAKDELKKSIDSGDMDDILESVNRFNNIR